MEKFFITRQFISSLVVVGLVLLLCLVAVGPVLAIENPTSTAIQGVKAFQNIFEDGDMLFFVRYDVNYASDPEESASDTFVVNLYDTDGTTLLYQRELSYYDLNITSIYLTEVQADSLVWESEYVIRVMGNLSVFGELTEGVNMGSRTFNPLYDYVSGDMEDSRDSLGIFCIATARVLQDDVDWPTLLTDNSKLNSSGALTFNTAILGLSSVCPSIYATSVSSPTLPTVTRTVTLIGTIAGGPFAAGETVTGAATGATGIFITGTETGTQIQVTHSGSEVDMFGEEVVTGGTSAAVITVSEVVVGLIEEAARGRTGTRLRDALDNFGAWVGISGNAFGGLALFVIFAITAGFVFTSTGNVHGGIIVSLPVIFLGNYLGLLSFAITWILVVVVVLLFAILFIMGRLA